MAARLCRLAAPARMGCRLLRRVRPAERSIRCNADSRDRILRSLSKNQEVAVLAIDGTGLVDEARGRHRTAPTATAALGRSLMGALLMATFRKADEALQITFNGNGLILGIQVIAESSGIVKGYVGNPLADPPRRADGKLNVGAAVGTGTLAVVRTQPLSPVPYTGVVPITSGEIAEDLAVYMADSEQTNSAIALGVQIDTDTTVKAAGGYLLQVLPFATDATLTKLEANIAAMPPVSDVLASGMSLETLTSSLLDGIGVDEGSVSEMQPTYGPCEQTSLQTRMKRAVAAIGEEEVKSIIEKEGKIEVTCQFCNETYVFDESEIEIPGKVSQSQLAES